MRLMKKLLTILFAFMMVLATTSMVSAAGETGTIKIDGAINGQEYSIYQILKLDSYDSTNDRYVYKPANDNWKTFIKTGEGSGYLNIDEDDFVTWKNSVSKDKVAELASKALTYAKTTTAITPTATGTKTDGTDLTFNVTSLGYYLVDSNVGAICSLDTTNPNATINEKNDIPDLKKEVQEDLGNSWKTDFATAKIGQKVLFRITITAKPGAENYVLTDKMSEGLTFNDDVKVYYENTPGSPTYLNDTQFSVDKSDTTYTFKVEFKDAYMDSLRGELGVKNATTPKSKDLIVTYSATLNENAECNVDTNTNTTQLIFGNSQKTTEKTVMVKTFKLPVHKYYIDPTDNTTRKDLAGAEFTLSKNSYGTTPIEFINVTTTGGVLTYRVAKETESAGVTKVTKIDTPTNGKFEILGLDAGAYYLTETTAPKGYNKLSKAVKVEIDNTGKLKVNDVDITGDVEIENKTGTVLPSTGGVGTTMMYIVGAALLIGSGVMLITKKNAK